MRGEYVTWPTYAGLMQQRGKLQDASLRPGRHQALVQHRSLEGIWVPVLRWFETL